MKNSNTVAIMYYNIHYLDCVHSGKNKTFNHENKWQKNTKLAYHSHLELH